MNSFSLLTDHDIYLFKEGNFFRSYEKLGSHIATAGDRKGVYFAVWAPNAESVSVIGDFNYWDPAANPLGVRWDSSGIWEGFIPDIGKGELYKYHIASKHQGYRIEKGDPFSFYWEVSPKTGSIVWDLAYEWHDKECMDNRYKQNSLTSHVSIYEVHLGSWRRIVKENKRFLTYKENAH